MQMIFQAPELAMNPAWTAAALGTRNLDSGRRADNVQLRVRPCRRRGLPALSGRSVIKNKNQGKVCVML
jgi:hypothetical protein